MVIASQYQVIVHRKGIFHLLLQDQHPRHIMPQRCKYTVSHRRNNSLKACLANTELGWNSLPVDRVRPWIGRELVPPAEEEHSLGKTGPRSSLSLYHPINVQFVRADQRERSLCILRAPNSSRQTHRGGETGLGGSAHLITCSTIRLKEWTDVAKNISGGGGQK